MTNFAAILDQQATEIEAPKPMPTGTYVFMVKGLPRMDKTPQKGTDFAEFTLIPLEPFVDAADVDEDDLEAAGGIEKFRERGMRLTFYITEDAKHRLKKFLTDCGIEPEGKSLGMMINEVPNQTVLGYVGHELSKTDGETIYAGIKRTAKVPA